jgi:ComF family protein
MNLDFLGDIFFPPACAVCGDAVPRGVVCAPCRQSITLFDSLFCGTCSARLPEQKKICHKDALYMLGAAGAYDDEALRELIHALKFRGMTAAAEPLADVLIAYATDLGLDLNGFAVVPVPLSKKRARMRGFNQAALIARPFARAMALPVEEHLLTRIAHRKRQSDTEDIFERRENVRGVFALQASAGVGVGVGADADGYGKNVILIDDVTTSGTTFAEAAAVLKAGGAKKILALAVAKA